jgi:phosphohistidine phosphatase SixA
LEFCADFYHAGQEAVFTELAGRDSDTILVLGHNPGWEHLTSSLAGHYVEMGTATAALLESDCDTWEEALEDGTWRLEALLRPRDVG